LQEGLSLFNKKPRKGIEFLVKANKVGESAEDVARFLRNGTGLDKTMIGDYLGEKEDFALKVMHAYVDSFNFQGMDFDEAIREFLLGFRLPGEAQKIDRIMEKFAERYCKCNPKAFTSADTAYVLGYSVIMLNTDAHNNMVKNKMSKAEFIRNNRGIDDGNDISEEFMGALYDRIVTNEIKMKADTPMPSKQPANVNRMLGLDTILNIVVRRPREESKILETSDDVIRYMQEQFKAKAGKSESVYYAASDVELLRPMVEVTWAPMLAAFSVPLDKSEEEVMTFQCLEGFRHAIHITAVLCMRTQRDAFLTSLAKFTSLHSAADIKQKNIDAIKAIISIADEDGNYLQDAWEHILTCVSRFEHLHLIGEGAPPDATFFAAPQSEADRRQTIKGPVLPVLRRKAQGRLQYAAAAARRGSYDSAGVGGGSAGVVTTEQMSNLVSNLNMLEQIGSFEVNKIFSRSQRLNSEAIVDFVKALCKVSMEELRSPSDPRVFSLTKIVEISHFNMTRIRLVWSRMWSVLADYFVTVGCSDNLSVAMYAMDSLRQLAMKFLEREELANYNFQNEFMKPFVIVMRKSSSVEIRELIIRCVSQMVFARVGNVKSGWKIMFMVFTTAATDEHKSIVLLAFETIEKIVREYFPYITETETTTFTDCVNCLIAFTNSRFDKDVSLNAIAFLRFCALKLAEGELGAAASTKDVKSAASSPKQTVQESPTFTDKDESLYFWFPLLAGQLNFH
jgi:brefeldin A-inhibited guanine nucleotide-exchange protein